MRKSLLILWSCLFLLQTAWANGVCIRDASNNVNLRLMQSHVDVSVESQIAIITTTQEFKNNLGQPVNVKYGFPLPEGASAIELRWQYAGQWYLADIGASQQDTTLPGGGDGIHQDLEAYLGETPLFFPIGDPIDTDYTITVQLKYVQLLPYEFGNVDFKYPNNYSLIQNTALDEQRLDFHLTSPRTINSIQLLSDQALIQLVNNGNDATIAALVQGGSANADYHVQYSLALNELGVFDFSTMLADSLIPDPFGPGFLTFIAEPDPSATNVIDKVFTLIIDRSGSMGWENKIQQARDAASFIMNNLNEGDKFNIVDFASGVSNFRNRHVLFTPSSRDSALTYISSIIASGSTNISGAFSVAVPQFSAANDSTANIIIFFTDGQATAGITDTAALLAHVQNLVAVGETNISIFTFGVGSDVNLQLLTLLAAQNNGLSVFLENDELFAAISQFYLQIRNPVLLNTQISFSPPIVTEVYPAPLPNLYKGQQMIVSGRYEPGTEASSVTVTLSGEAFGQPVSYDYIVNLSDSTNQTLSFLPKIWAKQKIEHLLVAYYSLDPDSPQALALKEEIQAISIGYGVISPFTRFSGGNPVGIEDAEEIEPITIAASFELLGNYPNPFNPSTMVRLKVHELKPGIIKIKIYNMLGQLVKVLAIQTNGSGIYEVLWDGTMLDGTTATSGQYVYVVEFENTILAGKMTLLK